MDAADIPRSRDPNTVGNSEPAARPAHAAREGREDPNLEQDVLAHVARIGNEIQAFLRTWIDGSLLATREALTLVVQRVVLGLLFFVMAATAVVLALVGAAGALAAAFGLPGFAGQLMLGITVLALPFALHAIHARVAARRRLASLRRRYEDVPSAATMAPPVPPPPTAPSVREVASHV